MSCGEQFTQEVIGSELPKYAECPRCHARIYNVSPLGNFVISLLMHRAKQELDNNDITLAIILSAVAVEGQMAYLFFKWKKVDSFTMSIKEQWSNEWTDMRSIGKRMDELSRFLTELDFDKFAEKKKALLQSALDESYYDPSTSFKDFFQKQLFEKRNKIVHYGEIDFQETEGMRCFSLGLSLLRLLDAMDNERIARMNEEHKKSLNGAPSNAS
jgi:hypothetical protein